MRIDDFRGDMKYSVDLRDHMGSRIFWFDSYSGIELSLISRLLSSGDVFVDIGANAGEFTLTAAKAVGHHGQVIAIEPLEAIRKKLARHVAWNGFSQVQVVGKAISDYDGTLDLFGPGGESGELHTGLPTAYPSDGRSHFIEAVRVTTLDALIASANPNKVTGIKLDIEGAELPALNGAASTLERFRPWLLVEIGENTCKAAGYEPRDVVSFLQRFDYALFKITEAGLQPIGGPQDLGEWQNVFARPRA